MTLYRMLSSIVCVHASMLGNRCLLYTTQVQAFSQMAVPEFRLQRHVKCDIARAIINRNWFVFSEKQQRTRYGFRDTVRTLLIQFSEPVWHPYERP